MEINWNVIKLLLAAGETPNIDFLEIVPATSHDAVKEFKEKKNSLKSLAGREEGFIEVTMQRSSEKFTAGTESSESVLQGSRAGARVTSLSIAIPAVRHVSWGTIQRYQ